MPVSAREQVTVGRVFHIVVQVLLERFVEEVRVGDCSCPGKCFRRLKADSALAGCCPIDCLGFRNGDGVVGQVDVVALEGADFTFPQPADSGEVDGEPVAGWHELVEVGELFSFSDLCFVVGSRFVGLYETRVSSEEGWVAVFVSACRTVENGFEEGVRIMACYRVVETMRIVPVCHHCGGDVFEVEVSEGGEEMVGYLFPVFGFAAGFEWGAVGFQMRVIPLLRVGFEKHENCPLHVLAFSDMWQFSAKGFTRVGDDMVVVFVAPIGVTPFDEKGVTKERRMRVYEYMVLLNELWVNRVDDEYIRFW